MEKVYEISEKTKLTYGRGYVYSLDVYKRQGWPWDNQGSETGKEERVGIVTENEILPETFGSICYCM